MKREELKALGLEDSVIDSIMTLHGNTLNDTKAKLKTAEDTVTQLRTDLTTAQTTAGNADQIRQQLATAQANLANIQKLSAVKDALGTYKPRSVDLLLKLVDLEKVSITDAGVVGLKDQVDPLKTAQPFLFADSADPQGGNLNTNPNPNPNTPPVDFAAAKAKALSEHNMPVYASLVRQEAAEAAKIKTKE